MKIDSSAHVSPKASLGKNIEVGPFAVIGDDVTLGDNCVVQAHAILTGKVSLGSGNLVGFGAVLGAAPQDYDHHSGISSGVVIGNDNSFREYVTIHCGTKEGTNTTVGNKNMLMCGVHLGHNCEIGDRNIIANNCLLAGYVHVSDDVVFGGGAVFHQFLRVGRMVMIRGGTAWSADIPPFTTGLIINTLGGLNSIGMRRKGVTSESRKEVKRAYQLIYRSGLNISQAVEESTKTTWGPEATEFLDFIRTGGKRGLCRARRLNRLAPDEPTAE